MGKLVNTLIENQVYDKGRYRILWDGKNERGKIMDRGIYIYIIKSEKQTFTGKIFIK